MRFILRFVGKIVGMEICKIVSMEIYKIADMEIRKIILRLIEE